MYSDDSWGDRSPPYFHKPFLGPSSVHCAMLTFVAAPLSAHAVAPLAPVRWPAPRQREGRGSGLVGWSSNEWRLDMISMGIYCNWIWWPLNPLIVWVRWIWLYIYLYPLVMTNIAMENDGPNRNRWFTVLNSMVNFHGELLYTMINNHQWSMNHHSELANRLYCKDILTNSEWWLMVVSGTT